MNVTLCVERNASTACLSNDVCYDFDGDQNNSIGCLALIYTNTTPPMSTASPILVSRGKLNGNLVAFLYFILAVIFIGLVYGIIMALQKRHRQNVWNIRVGTDITQDINCNDQEDIEMKKIAKEVPTCGEEDCSSEDIIYTSDSIIVNSRPSSTT